MCVFLSHELELSGEVVGGGAAAECHVYSQRVQSLCAAALFGGKREREKEFVCVWGCVQCHVHSQRVQSLWVWVFVCRCGCLCECGWGLGCGCVT